MTSITFARSELAWEFTMKTISGHAKENQRS